MADTQASMRGHFASLAGNTAERSEAPPHRCYEATDGFTHLQAHVAPRAYATQQEGEAPKCHPNTRTAVLNDILDWILLAVSRTQWVMWVYGAAGAGKSAIARSIVDICIRQNIPIIRFFFYRTDSTRNTLDPVVATLCNQLLRQLPDLKPIIVPLIADDPHIFKQSFETQLETLLLGPLRQLHHDSPIKKTLVILFDGVDECTGRDAHSTLIKTLMAFVEGKDIPVVLLFLSRAENDIQYVFRTPQLSDLTKYLALDDNYLPDRDIERFLRDKFAEIRTAHAIRATLPQQWPDEDDIQKIIQKSSGQFIYASVVMNFISDLSRNPATQLKIILGLQPAGKLTPFAQLDALYIHIFSQVDDLDRVLICLSIAIFLPTFTTMPVCAELLEVPEEDIYLLFTNMMSVIQCKDRNIRFLHASLTDFLCDHGRSGDLYLDKATSFTKLALLWLRCTAKPIDFLMNHVLPFTKCTEELRECIWGFFPQWALEFEETWSVAEYLGYVKRMDFGDDGKTYLHQVSVWAKAFPKVLEDNHDTISLVGSRTEVLKKRKNILARIGSKTVKIFKKGK